MPLDINPSRKHLKEFNFEPLFIEELGWDHYDKELVVSFAGKSFTLSAIAEKRGMAAFRCPAPPDGRIPDYATRRKIEKQTAKSAHEHIIVYTDPEKSTQIWQWVKRESGKPAACREHAYHKNQPGDSLLQKLRNIAFTIEDEESLTLPQVTGRARAAFDVEKVTKKFYDRFKKEHDAFFDFIAGIPDDDLHTWYASVMLNRIMFIYFVQKKGFLDDDPDYLRKRLEQSMKQGKDLFYKEFLSPLFFEGFAKKGEERSAKMNRLLGDVPYLNGGLFLKHQIEELHGRDIQISDKAFQKLFDFFDQYQWHLDERPCKKDNEINPDVLGYIFEKYINQKQMGAYYTKEDITEYISKNTVIPFLFDEARKKCKIAFEGEQSVWNILKSDPDRYIYDAVKKGVEHELPEEIAVGIKDVSKRTEWNRPALAEYALPTEIWREVVARRQRYEEVRSKMEKGEIQSINDLITYNLDIRQFAQDVIWNSEGPELLRAFYEAIEKVKVLDPTCGSGAFLFAALNILEPLYEACLDRMQVFIGELELSETKHRKDKYADFKELYKRVGAHPKPRYFIYKSIIVNNLYGVDIMEEAIEICKLRLFLKLIAQIDKVKQIEPLPDIDFNIRTGNTLVGYATYDEVKKAVTGKDQMAMQFDDAMPRIEEQAEYINRLLESFHKQQTKLGGVVTPEDKQELKDKLKVLEDELNQHLAGEYGITLTNKKKYDKWLKSHHPFHWFIEFYGILKNGGFDVIIGNPPWVEFLKVKHQYVPHGLATLECNNLWAYVVEKSYDLALKNGRVGLIVPMSLVCTERMVPVQAIVEKRGTAWLSNFESDSNPGQLFDGVKQNVTIMISSVDGLNRVYTTHLQRFFQEFRDYVAYSVEYVECPNKHRLFGFPKISSPKAATILVKMFEKRKLSTQIHTAASTHILVHRIAHYYIKCFDFVPYFRSKRDGIKKSEDYKKYFFQPPIEQYVSAINSSAFYFYWQVFFDAFKAGKLCVESFPFGNVEDKKVLAAVIVLAHELMRDMQSKSTRLKAKYAATGDVEYDQFYPRNSKHIMDKIDRVLAKHYGFTDEELDFIINYDIKYRMGIDN